MICHFATAAVALFHSLYRPRFIRRVGSNSVIDCRLLFSWKTVRKVDTHTHATQVSNEYIHWAAIKRSMTYLKIIQKYNTLKSIDEYKSCRSNALKWKRFISTFQCNYWGLCSFFRCKFVFCFLPLCWLENDCFVYRQRYTLENESIARFRCVIPTSFAQQSNAHSTAG